MDTEHVVCQRARVSFWVGTREISRRPLRVSPHPCEIVPTPNGVGTVSRRNAMPCFHSQWFAFCKRGSYETDSHAHAAGVEPRSSGCGNATLAPAPSADTTARTDRFELPAPLSSIPLFQGLTTHALGHLAKSATERETARRNCFFVEGQEAKEFFVLISGRVKISRHTAEGRQLLWVSSRHTNHSGRWPPNLGRDS